MRILLTNTIEDDVCLVLCEGVVKPGEYSSHIAFGENIVSGFESYEFGRYYGSDYGNAVGLFVERYMDKMGSLVNAEYERNPHA